MLRIRKLVVLPNRYDGLYFRLSMRLKLSNIWLAKLSKCRDSEMHWLKVMKGQFGILHLLLLFSVLLLSRNLASIHWVCFWGRKF